MYKDTDSLKLTMELPYQCVISHDNALCFYDLAQNKKELNQRYGKVVKGGNKQNGVKKI